MSVKVDIIPGPAVAEVSRDTAERGLRSIASRRQASSYSLEQSNGQWVGALVFEATEKLADGNPFGGGDEEEESPAPKPEAGGGEDEGPADDAGPDGPPSDGGDADGPPKDDKGEKGKGGEDHLLHQLMDAVRQIGDALGVPLNLGGSPVPGMDPAAGPPGPPGGPAGPPSGPPGAPPSSHGDKFPKPMHPGDAPPGVPPIGTPAFSSVREDHPWREVAGKVASFQAQKPIGDAPIHEVTAEVERLANEIGYTARVQEGRSTDGQRVANCLITVHQQ